MDSGYQGHNLVFIVGCPRSGTTWLQRLLACHPEIRTGHESNIFSGYVGPLVRSWRAELASNGRGGGVGLPCYLTEKEFHHLVTSFLMDLLAPMINSLREDELFLEKTPGHALFIPLIAELLPRARFIHIYRDPRDVVASLQAAARSWGQSWAPRRPSDAIAMWLDYVTAAQEAGRQLAESQFLEVTYEDLRRGTAGQLKRCGRFLDRQWSEEAIREAIESNTPGAAIKTGGGTPIPLGGEIATRLARDTVVEPDGFIRRADTDNWRNDLTLWDQFWVWRKARGTMAPLGYQWPRKKRLVFTVLNAGAEILRRRQS